MAKTSNFAAARVTKSKRQSTIGFGVPTTSSPHHFQVNVPSARKDTVEIWEHLGMKAVSEEQSVILRCSLQLPYWKKVKHEVQISFNQRLREHKLNVSSWKTGNNLVDRLLGKELCVLAWTIENLNIENTPLALNSWIGLLPEERWWLYGKAVRTTDEDYKKGFGWRAALKYALTSHTNIQLPSSTKRPCFATQDQFSLSLEKQ